MSRAVGCLEQSKSSATEDAAMSCRARRRLGVGILFMIMLLGEIAHWARTGADLKGVMIRVAFMLVYVPVHVTVMSLAYEHALRRRWGPLKTIGFTAGLSMLNAMTLTTAYYAIGAVFPAVRHSAPGGGPQTLVQALALGAVMGPMHLGVWVLAFIYPFAAHDARERALEAEKLRGAAELARLRGHLEPHFILNTLNAIAGLVTEDPREARRLIGCLGDLLRDALREGDEMQTLGEEEAWLRRYAAILESRHKGALSFRWEIDPAVKGALVPRLLLQPLVENAVKHGALRRRGGGVVTVRASRAKESESVRCVVEDDGPGFVDRPVRKGAIGLSLVRRRLELKYEQSTFEIQSSSHGTSAVVTFARPRRSGPELVASVGAAPVRVPDASSDPASA